MEEEAAKLKERFVGVNRAKFARDFGVKGGQANIYNHIQGLRPINLDAARAYARGFNCTIQEISPRLARQLSEAAPYALESSGGLEIREPEPIEYGTYDQWPFKTLDREKISKFGAIDLARLETAIVLAAGQLNLDVKKNP